jgi:hypothetical protein
MTLSTSYGNSLAQNALPAHLQKAPLVTLLREFTRWSCVRIRRCAMPRT